MLLLSSYGLRTLRSTVAGRITRRFLNRILFEGEEVQEQGGGLVAHLPAEDFRAKHINTILKLELGANLRCGVADRGMTDRATLLSRAEDGGLSVSLGLATDLFCNDRPGVDLLLCVPRPQKMERLLPIVACLGVGRLYLVEAAKVQKDYFGSHLFRKPSAMRALLLEGLMQAEVDCQVPQVTIVRSHEFRRFLEGGGDFLEGGDGDGDESLLRVVAHPQLIESGGGGNGVGAPDSACEGGEGGAEVAVLGDSIKFSQFMRQVGIGTGKEVVGTEARRRIVVAVGPEGGWERAEVVALRGRGFQLVDLGPRILRTDIAVPVLLGLAHEFLD
ncbi:Alpha/beta knot methyltransferase [Ochromonadaceae sp. CCMP2298]|nr:Alpha/beta knot methyltransferase [Ochromonadaceae sp. CCMP2298]